MTRNDKVAWELGWDFALYGWPLPNDLCTDFADGYRAFGHGGKRPTKKPSMYERKWLQLRANALRRGKFFDAKVTPDYIRHLMPVDKCCPVTKQPFTFATQEDTDWSIERACNDSDYVLGNLIMISARANSAKSNYRFSRIVEFAEGKLQNDRLSQREWMRLAEVVAPMNADEGERCGVNMLCGQKVACGTFVSPLVRFQRALAIIALQEKKQRSSIIADCLFEVVESALCQSRKEQRALRRLIVAVRQRAGHVTCQDRLWGAPRVLKRLDSLVLLLDASSDGVAKRLEGIVEKIEDGADRHPRLSTMREAGLIAPARS